MRVLEFFFGQNSRQLAPGKSTGQCGVRHGGDNILLRQVFSQKLKTRIFQEYSCLIVFGFSLISTQCFIYYFGKSVSFSKRTVLSFHHLIPVLFGFFGPRFEKDNFSNLVWFYFCSELHIRSYGSKHKVSDQENYNSIFSLVFYFINKVLIEQNTHLLFKFLKLRKSTSAKIAEVEIRSLFL